VADEGLADLVTLRPAAFGEIKDRLLLRADVLLFPTYREGLPYVLLESMAAGTVPVICPVGAIPDVMQDGVHGLFVPVKDAVALADAVARLNADREDLARMSAACRRRIVERYTVARLAAEFEVLYESI
jgi:glycosyltransferase involved in cell wall biosynthesis